jgi:hypothetical protein
MPCTAAGYSTGHSIRPGLMRWGKRGSGRWITSYANPGHAYMVVAGLRFDTGYGKRHPAGL